MRPGRRFFRAILRLLPGRVRIRVGDEMLAVYDARMADAPDAAARARVWLSEVVGAGAAAQRLRGRPGAGPRIAGGWLGDASFALRTMIRRPTPALLAVLTCGLGIGSAAAMFSVVDGVLLRPLPWPDPERVVSIYPTLEEWREIPNLRAYWDRGSFSQPEFVEWSARQTSFSDVALVSVWTRYLTGRGRATLVRTGRTTEGLFAIADTRPVLGRLLRAEDGDAGAEPVTVITHAFWQARLGGDEDVIGETIVLNDVAYTLVGVLPARFRLTGHEADLWVPVSQVADERERENHNYKALGRLAPGVTPAQAQQESEMLLRAISEAHERLTHGANIEPRLEDVTREVRGPLLVLLCGALILLVAACANFAGLLLGAGLDRSTELAVRGALGAGRRRILRLLLTESTLLAVLGGAAGIVLALALTRALVLVAPPGVPRIEEVAVNVRVVAVASALALLAGVVFGAIPALALGRDDVAARLRAARVATRRRHRLHAGLVIAQVALATLLLVAAGLLGRTLLHLDGVDPGFEPDGLLAVSVAAPVHRFFDDEGAFRRGAYGSFFDDIRSALEEVPGVSAVAATALIPFSGSRANNDIVPEGYEPAPGERLVAERSFVSGNYLDVIGARVVDGRLLGPADDRADAAPVMVVSRRLAQRFWPDGSALGRRISFWGGEFTVVGVIEDMRDLTLDGDDLLRFYAPAKPASQTADGFVLRTSGDPARLANDVRDRLAAFDADLPVARIEPMRVLIDDTLAEQRYRARLLLYFAVLALFFAASGIYGALSRRVALRRHEIGVRMALGARRSGILANVVREGVALAGTGILIGIAAALGGSRLVAAWLSGVSPTDPLTYVTITGVLATTAALAALAPSLRAARTDPMDSLRAD